MNEKQAYDFYERLQNQSGAVLNRQQKRSKIRNLIKAKEYKNKKINEEYEKFILKNFSNESEFYV